MEKSVLSKELKILLRFLKEKGAYKAWITGVRENCKIYNCAVKEKIEILSHSTLPLFSSFIFASTKQGHNFWALLNTEFEDEYKEKYIAEKNK